MGYSGGSVGGPGEAGNWIGYDLTTSATPNAETSTNYGQPIFYIKIVNDGTATITFGFGVTTATKSYNVKASESLTVELVHRTLFYKSASASQNFRVLVIW